jgi:hypothetical protein
MPMSSFFEDWELFDGVVWVLAAFVAGVVVAATVFFAGRRLLSRVKERRAYPRRWGNPVQALISGYSGGSAKAVVVNRSDGGVAILVNQPAVPGTTFKIRPAEAPQSIPWVSVEVRHCRSAGRDWFVGCRFEDEVSWETMVWFG